MQEIEKNMALLWPTPVYSVSFIDCDSFLHELSESVLREELKMAQIDDQVSALLFNRFSSLRDKQDLVGQGDDMSLLLQIIEEHASIFLRENYPQFSTSFEVRIWANIHRYGDWHGTHSHYSGGTEIASGVFWTRVPTQIVDGDDSVGGKLILFDPRGPFFHERKRVIMTPRPGKLVIFPSWLQHEVAPLRCDGTRISVAFDVKRI